MPREILLRFICNVSISESHAVLLRNVHKSPELCVNDGLFVTLHCALCKASIASYNIRARY